MQGPFANQYWLINSHTHRPRVTVFGAWLYQDRYMALLTALIYSALAISLALILTVCTSVYLWRYPTDMEPKRTGIFMQMIDD